MSEDKKNRITSGGQRTRAERDWGAPLKVGFAGAAVAALGGAVTSAALNKPQYRTPKQDQEIRHTVRAEIEASERPLVGIEAVDDYEKRMVRQWKVIDAENDAHNDMIPGTIAMDTVMAGAIGWPAGTLAGGALMFKRRRREASQLEQIKEVLIGATPEGTMMERVEEIALALYDRFDALSKNTQKDYGFVASNIRMFLEWQGEFSEMDDEALRKISEPIAHILMNNKKALAHLRETETGVQR